MRQSTHKEDRDDEERNFEFDDDSVIWLNITRSGKGVKIVTPDGAMFISSIVNIEKLVSGEYTGVKFTELVEVVG
jgi:hypothetical protein